MFLSEEVFEGKTESISCSSEELLPQIELEQSWMQGHDLDNLVTGVN